MSDVHAGDQVSFLTCDKASVCLQLVAGSFNSMRQRRRKVSAAADRKCVERDLGNGRSFMICELCIVLLSAAADGPDSGEAAAAWL